VVDDAERAEIEAIMRMKGDARVEAQPELSSHQGVDQRAWISLGIRYDPRLVVEDRRGAKARTARDLTRVNAVVRFEPDAVVINDADDRDGNLEVARREARDTIKCSVWRCVEDVVAPYNSQTLSVL
jgi:hypothetical protein